jgi:methylmalonyl-CoA mutase cobalamin-binding subunit
MREQGIDEVLVVVGDIIPPAGCRGGRFGSAPPP